MNSSSEVVIIGGGISGVAAAYELARSGVAVTVLERGNLAAMASGRTLAGVRQSGRHPAEVPLARAAVRRWERLADELDADLEYRQDGNLRLARNEAELPAIRRLVEEQSQLGLELELLADNRSVRQVAPALSESIVAASFCPTDGHANPLKTVLAFAAAAQRRRAGIRTEVEVTRIETAGGRVTGVQTDAGPVRADSVVVAAGIHSPELLRPLGIELPITLEHVAAVQSVPLPPLIQQVIGVANGDVAGRQQVDGHLRFTGTGERWRGGNAWATGEDFLQPPMSHVVTAIERFAAVIPAIREAPLARIWGGLIDVTADALPVIERVPDVEGLVLAAGFSGHGFCLGPVTGQIVRDLVISGATDLPIEPFRRGRPGLRRREGEAPTLHG